MVVVVGDEEGDDGEERAKIEGKHGGSLDSRSDTKLMWNADGRRGDRRWRKEGLPGCRKLRVRCRRGGCRDHPREGWGALAALFKHTRQKVEEEQHGNPEWSQKRTLQILDSIFISHRVF